MALPLFYHSGALQQSSELALAEDTAKHVAQVLRMQAGDQLMLTDGKGHIATASIIRTEKKKCNVVIDSITAHAPRQVHLHLCVAFTKNSSRNEWLLEKATELGATSIIPLLASRSEKTHVKQDRWNNILIAALIQSRQAYLPELFPLTLLRDILQRFNWVQQKLVGHCMDELPRTYLKEAMKEGMETLMLIGPEGDFTAEEVEMCIANNFTGVHMGGQRLRTETAAMAACAFFNLINNEA